MPKNASKSSKLKQYIAIFALAVGYSSIYLIPYVKYVYYDVMMQVLNTTNEQLGWLVSMYAMVCILWYIPGGYLADKFSAKQTIAVSLASTGLLCFWFVTSLTWKTAVIVWFLLSITTASAYWPAVIKAVRLTGTKEEQGKVYGVFEGFCGLASTVISLLGVFVFSRFSNDIAGFKSVIIFYGAMNILSAVLTYFLYEETMTDNDLENAKSDKINLKDIGYVLKLPQIWIVSILIFCAYGLYVGQTFLTPYTTNVLGVTIGFSGLLAVFRTYGLRLLGGPIGGLLSEKVGSTSKILKVLFVIVGIMLASFLFVPSSANLIITLILVVGLLTAIMKGIFWSTVEEAGIPRRVAGTTVGITTIIGFLPDSIFHALFGNWLDRFGNKGYNYIFIFLTIMCVVGLLTSIGVLYYGKKVESQSLE